MKPLTTLNSSICMRSCTHSYLALSEALFGILTAWKWDSSRVMRHFEERLFQASKMPFLKGHEFLGPQVNKLHRSSVRHFGALIMRLFFGHETVGWGIHYLRWPRPWKCRTEALLRLANYKYRISCPLRNST